MPSRPRSRNLTWPVLAARAGAAAAVSLGLAGRVQAITIQEALASAYATNPSLGAARVQLRGTDELVPQAKALRLPTLNAVAGVGYIDDQVGSRVGPVLGAEFRVPIVTAGRASAAIRQASSQVTAGQARLVAAEQDVLLRAATAYVDVLQAQQVLQAATANADSLGQTFGSAQRRFEAGELTGADVSQVQVQQAAARARQTQAEGSLAAARQIFREIVGAEPADLTQPEQPFGLPASRDEALAQSMTNPNVGAAERTVDAARSGADLSLAAMRPFFDIRGSYQTLQSNVLAVVTVPFYDGGLSQSRARQAHQQVRQSELDLQAQQRNARQAAFSAWQGLETARSNTKVYQSQLELAGAAREGIRREAAQGLRTQFQLLDAEQQVLNAQVSLISAKRDATIAAYQLLAATGRLNARDLALDTEVYDPVPAAQRAADRIYDFRTQGRAYGIVDGDQ